MPRTPASTVAELLRSSWRAVTRVVAEAAARTDRLSGLTRIGIDEKPYRKASGPDRGHRPGHRATAPASAPSAAFRAALSLVRDGFLAVWLFG